jgi:hypothetical protein
MSQKVRSYSAEVPRAGAMPEAPYPVSGARDDKKDVIVMTGPAPSRIPNSCEVTLGSTQSKNARLVFDVRIDGDE